MISKDKIYSLSFLKTYKNIYILLFFGFVLNIVSVYTNTIDRYGHNKLINEMIFIFISIIISLLLIKVILISFHKNNIHKTLNILTTFNIAVFIFGIVLAILMVFLPQSIVPLINGAKRWIITPFFSISPIEIIKYGFLFTIALLFSTNKFIFYLDKKHSFELYIPFYVFFLFLTIFVVLFQKDFGNFVLLSLIFLIIVFIYFKKRTTFYIFIFLAIVLFILFIISEEHRINRVLSWFYSIYNTTEDNNYNNYQILQGLYTINEGLLESKIFGCGIFESVIKQKVPELHTDMVFVSLISETGLLGLFIYLSFITILSYEFLKNIKGTNSYLLYIYTFAIICYFWLTIFINLFGVVGLIPFKGISVPFLSYGGSNLITNTLLIVNYTLITFLISIKNTKKNIEYIKKNNKT